MLLPTGFCGLLDGVGYVLRREAKPNPCHHFGYCCVTCDRHIEIEHGVACRTQQFVSQTEQVVKPILAAFRTFVL